LEHEARKEQAQAVTEEAPKETIKTTQVQSPVSQKDTHIEESQPSEPIIQEVPKDLSKINDDFFDS